MIDAGLAIALASDYNPGSSPSGNMSFILSLACIKLGMLPEEALNAVTLNSAFAMGLSASEGSITPGKSASFIITKKIPGLAYIPYSYGSDLIEHVFCKSLQIR
jgi:imidazolonepropionase